MAKNTKKKSLALVLRNYFITGVVVLIPIGFTLYLSKFLIGLSSKILPQNINPNSYLPISIPGIEIIITIIFITIVGGLSLSFIGKRILKLIDDLFKRIPFLRTVYSAIVQMTETFSKKDNDKKSVVLIEYPRKGFALALGLATIFDLFFTRIYTRNAVPLISNITTNPRLCFPIKNKDLQNV